MQKNIKLLIKLSKMKKLIFSILFLIFTSCANMGLYDNMKFSDEKGQEYILKYAYAGYYFLEIKNDSGRYVSDSRFIRLKNKNNRKNKHK